MSRTYHHGERHIRVRGAPRDPVDLRRMARALIAMVQAQLEAEAQENAATSDSKTRASTKNISPVVTDDGPAAAEDGSAA
jgi:hypothetical protein